MGRDGEQTRAVWALVLAALKDAGACAAATFCTAALLQGSFRGEGGSQSWLVLAIVINAFIFPASAFGIRVYRIASKYFSFGDFFRLAIASGFLFLISAVFIALGPEAPDQMRGVAFPFFTALLTFVFASMIRAGERLIAWKRPLAVAEHHSLKRALIIGAGDSGELTVREMKRSSEARYIPVGLIDDDPLKASLQIHGVSVLGHSEDIPELVEALEVDTILIAIPSGAGSQIKKIVDICTPTGVEILNLPSMNSLMELKGPISGRYREVQIEDLLRRKPVPIDKEIPKAYIGGERVLVTGGGGSIGSELARQVVKLSPAAIILTGKGENSLHSIQLELTQTTGIVPEVVVADVRDEDAMRRLFKLHRPTVVFHAAAHKHVPLMQANPIEAILNNVRGTWTVAKLSQEFGVKKMICISTDKAVSPSSIMGASKRVAELVVNALSHHSETEYAVVRFGNVLGSRGSLIPILSDQIRRGGPVTVTHPEMTRFFMTIPEAAQLVLQAGAMGKHGEIFILDMGEPIRILDMVNDLIKLHGLTPGTDIRIEFIGTRPGEKLHEELTLGNEELVATTHPKIRRVGNDTTGGKSLDWVEVEVNRMLDFCSDGQEDKAAETLMNLAWGKAGSVQIDIEEPEQSSHDADLTEA
jgi:FlaA1/EpsC-like NDP-sugar epimerase